MFRSLRAQRGVSLVELLVALVLLEIAAVGALAAALTSARVARQADLGGQTDSERWSARREAELTGACQPPSPGSVVLLTSPANSVRAAVTVAIRCGS